MIILSDFTNPDKINPDCLLKTNVTGSNYFKQ